MAGQCLPTRPSGSKRPPDAVHDGSEAGLLVSAEKGKSLTAHSLPCWYPPTSRVTYFASTQDAASRPEEGWGEWGDDD